MANKLLPEVLDYFRKQGSKGGKIGGKMSMETMTPAQRTARAKKAAEASVAVRSARKPAAPGKKPV